MWTTSEIFLSSLSSSGTRKKTRRNFKSSSLIQTRILLLTRFVLIEYLSTTRVWGHAQMRSFSTITSSVCAHIVECSRKPTEADKLWKIVLECWKVDDCRVQARREIKIYDVDKRRVAKYVYKLPPRRLSKRQTLLHICNAIIASTVHSHHLFIFKFSWALHILRSTQTKIVAQIFQ